MTSEIPFPPGSSVVAYLRDSGGDDQDLSVAQQEDAVRAWCLENGLILTKVFHDDARPGSTVVGRDQFLRMINFFHYDNPDERGVILWKYSRFSREFDDATFFKADLRHLGFQIYSLQDRIPDTLDGRIYESLVDWMNHRFLLDLSSDVKRGLHHNLNQYGAMPGIPPKGFKREVIELGRRRDGSTHQVARWIPDSDTWDLCKRAWEMRAEGISYRQINERLRLYKSVNCYNTFFTNRIYLGEMKFGDTVIPDYAPPMISQEVWDKVQRINRHQKTIRIRKGDNPQHPRRVGGSFLLSGLVYCAQCGAPLNGNVVHFRDGEEYDYYMCSRAGQTHECTARRIPRYDLEAIVFKTLRDFILDPDMVFKRQQQMIRNQAHTARQIETERQEETNRLKRIRTEISNLNDIVAQEGKNTPRSTLEKLIALERDETLSKTRLSELKKENSSITTMTPEEARIIAENLQRAIDREGPDQLKIMLHGIVKRICSIRDGKKIRGMVYFYQPPADPPSPPPPNGGSGDTGDPPKNKNFMPISGTSVEAPTHTHKVFKVAFNTRIHRKKCSKGNRA